MHFEADDALGGIPVEADEEILGDFLQGGEDADRECP